MSLAGRTLSVVFLLLIVSGCSELSASKSEAKASDDSVARSSASDTDEVTLPDDRTEQSVPVEGCNRKTIGEESGPLAVAYAVSEGQIALEPCLGDASPIVENAWNDLARISPVQLIDGVTIVAGFDDAGSDTLAYAAPVANDSDEHLIAVGLGAAEDDPEELRLTMAHELAHVFTQTTDQIDVAVFDDECDTFFNGFGCFQADAYVTAWVDQFWDPAVIASLPDDFGVDIDGGEERCAVDPGFPGSYAASHPEEDFAESFSAFVFDIALPQGLDDRLAFFAEFPEFVEMRAAVRADEVDPPANNFDQCG